MLISKTWALSPKEVTPLPRHYYLELVKQLHEKLSLNIGEDRIPSVSYSGLLGQVKNTGEFITFSPEETYQLKICSLNAETSSQVASLDLSPSLDFLGGSFQVLEVEQEQTSYEQLYTYLVAEEPTPSREFQLNFLTPTAFSQDRGQLPLPVPELMFRSWLNRWNHFAPIYLGEDELLEYLTQGVKIKHHRIKTHNFALPKGYITGFTGTVTLTIPRRFDQLLANVAHLLCEYSSFASTGVKTRLGMGQTQLLNKDK